MIVIILIILFSYSLGAEPLVFERVADCERLKTDIVQPYTLTHLSYKSDVVFPSHEFLYLVDLPLGSLVDADSLGRAIRHLFEKNKFEKIIVHTDDYEGGKKLIFELQGWWTFEKLKISGVWVHKDWYKQYYLMESGDPFDVKKHKHSVKKIKELSRADGFFNVETQTTFDYDDTTKSVRVNLALHRGKRFSIDMVDLKVKGDLDDIEKKTIQAQLIKKFARPLHRAKYSKTMLKDQAHAIKKYLAYCGFLHVSVSLDEKISTAHETVNITWKLTIHKKKAFVFFGNRYFSSNQLLDRILAFGRSAWILPATILAEELERAYNDKGFWAVSIDVQDDDKSIFVITEGKRAQIDAVVLHNCKQGNEQLLIKHSFKKMMRHRYFEQELLQSSFDSLISWYINHGFLEAKMVSYEFKELKDAHYQLHITVDEGVQTLIDIVAIEGFAELMNQGPFLAASKRAKPIPFDPVMLYEQRQWLLNHFHAQGYLQVEVSHALEKQQDLSVLVWRVQTGHKIRFGKTILQGSSTLPTPLIMRELKYSENEVWDPQKVRASFLRLKELKVFDSVSFAPLTFGQKEGVRPILLKLQQDDPFELRVRAGLELQNINQYQTFGGLAYKVGGSFMVKNPTNHADQFRFDADVALSHREVNCSYNYPWIANMPIDGVIQGYGIKYDQPGFIGSKNNLYTFFQNGALVGLRHRTAIIDVGVNLGFEIARTRINKDDVASQQQAEQLAIAIDFNPALLNKRVPFVFVEPTMIINALDNNLNPSRGSFSLLSCKGMFPTNETFSKTFFVRVLVEHSWFYSLGPVINAWRVRLGHIFHRLFVDTMPGERFYLGGAQSVRSYQTDQAPPLGIFVDCDGNSQLVPRGGKTMMNINAELRIQTFKNVGVVLFQDIGVLSGDAFADFNANNLVAGTGAGLRLFTPIGPLRFDVACKWKKLYPQESRFNWFLTFGQAF